MSQYHIPNVSLCYNIKNTHCPSFSNAFMLTRFRDITFRFQDTFSIHWWRKDALFTAFWSPDHIPEWKLNLKEIKPFPSLLSPDGRRDLVANIAPGVRAPFSVHCSPLQVSFPLLFTVGGKTVHVSLLFFFPFLETSGGSRRKGQLRHSSLGFRVFWHMLSLLMFLCLFAPVPTFKSYSTTGFLAHIKMH